MVTKNQVDNLLKKNITPKEVARLLIADTERTSKTSDSQAFDELSEELTFGEAERQKLKESQTQKERWETSQWFEAQNVIGFAEYQGHVDGLEAIESLSVLSGELKELYSLRKLYYAEGGNPTIMTQKEYEEKKEALWEYEKNEKEPIAHIISAKADRVVMEEETSQSEKTTEIYEEAEKRVNKAIEENGLEPKELEEPAEKAKIQEGKPFFEVEEGTDRHGWLYKTYLTVGELGKAGVEPYTYATGFNLSRYKEKVEGESPGYHGTKVAIIQNPTENYLDEKGWYDNPRSQYELDKEVLEESAKDLAEENTDSLQKFYDTIREKGVKGRISAFKAQKQVAKHFYQALGLDIGSSQNRLEEIEDRLKDHLNVYARYREELQLPGDRVVWHFNSGEEVEFKEIKYEEIEPSQFRLKEWGEQVEQYLEEGWLEKDPEEVVVK